MQNELVKKLAENYPHTLELALRNSLLLIAESLSPNSLHLEATEYLHLIREKKWNYKQVSALLNNFFNLSFKFFEANGVDKGMYAHLVQQAQRHIELWNRDIKPIKESIDRQQSLLVSKPGLIKGQA